MANATFILTNLNGSNGFSIFGTNNRERLGFSISDAGDINGDGIGDLIVGAPGDFATAENTDRGRAYVIFGTGAGFASTINAASLNGSNGFLVDGINSGDNAGISVSNAGDINSDGIQDFLVGNGFSTIGTQSNNGSAYVILGSTTSFGTNFSPSALNGGNGFIVNGVSAEDRLGASVSNVGDINQDGFADFLVGAPKNTAQKDEAGASYLVYGKGGGFDANLNLTVPDASKFTTINGLAIDDSFGVSVGSAGDVNGDGIGDLIVGSSTADPNGINNAGSTYIIFGRSGGLGTSFDLASLNGSNGFAVNGFQENSQLGFSVSNAGDINSDGIGDIIIGARGAGEQRGAAYVVFGSRNGFAASIDPFTLDGSNGFAFYGKAGSQAGFSVSGAGDVNGDGIEDAIVGAPLDSPNGVTGAGSAYVIFGKSGGFSREQYASTVNRSNGLVFNGFRQQDLLGSSVSGAGDINAGGVTDIAIGASAADNKATATEENFGAGYAIAGENFRLNPTGGAPFEATNSGFTLRLAKALDLGVLNIYDGVDAAVDAADITLVRDGTENIRGSLVYDPTSGTVNFVKTGGALEAGNYTVTVRSGSDAFIYTDGSDLNLDGDGNAQTNFTTTFNVSNAGTRLLNVTDISRGLAESTPVGVSLNNANGVSSIQFTMRYDPQLLNVTGVNLDSSLANLGWTNSSTFDPLTGVVNVNVQGNALGAGATNVINLSADGRSDAIYNSSGLIAITDPLLNGGAIGAKGDTSLHQVTQFGDVSGNGLNGGLDANLIAGIGGSTQGNAGFDVLSLVDPNIVGDLDGNSLLNADDVAISAKKAVGLA
jgi:hypothetical protein